MKKRNKKYNPNKSVVNRIQQSKADRQRNEWEGLDLLYEFEMQFYVEDVNKALDEYVDKHNVSEGEYLPESVVVSAYEEQDMIIALKNSLLKVPEQWEIKIESYFYSLEKEKMHTIPFKAVLPAVPYPELLAGSKMKFSDSGIKREWRGLQKEMIENWELKGIPEGYELIRSQIYMKCQAHFKNLDAYKAFSEFLQHRDNGTLIEFLQNKERKEVIEMIAKQKWSEIGWKAA